jgi:hypothetical protein
VAGEEDRHHLVADLLDVHAAFAVARGQQHPEHVFRLALALAAILGTSRVDQPEDDRVQLRPCAEKTPHDRYPGQVVEQLADRGERDREALHRRVQGPPDRVGVVLDVGPWRRWTAPLLVRSPLPRSRSSRCVPRPLM